MTGSIAADGQTTITGQLKFPLGSVSAPSHSWAAATDYGMYSDGSTVRFAVAGVDALILTSTGPTNGNSAVFTPVGMVVDYAGSSAPAGWLLCYGQAISRTTYSALFAVTGTTYGTGDGSTTFNLPDLRGRVVAGKDNMGGSTAGRITVAGGNFDATVLGGAGGSQNGTLTQAMLPDVTIGAGTLIVASGQGSHTHDVKYSTFNFTAGGVPAVGSISSAGTITGTAAAVASTLPQMTVSGSTDSINGGVTQDTAPLVQPTFILNKIIYAGV